MVVEIKQKWDDDTHSHSNIKYRRERHRKFKEFNAKNCEQKKKEELSHVKSI